MVDEKKEKVVKEKKELPALWAMYDVQWNFITQLCGQTPGNPEIIDKWLSVRMAKNKPVGGKTLPEIAEEVVGSIAVEEDEKPPLSLLVFQHDMGGGRNGGGGVDNGLVMRAATVRAHLKDCARVVSAQYMQREEGERAFSTKVINGLYVDETMYWIPLLKQDGTRIMKADGNRDKAIHVKGSRGENINALKNFEYVEDAQMNFTLKVLGESITEKQLHLLMSYGGVHGYGGERGDGEGKYTFTLTKR